MQKPALHKPIKVNQDKDPKYLGQDEARFMLNAERNLSGGGKGNLGKTTGRPANELLCSIALGEDEIDTFLRVGSFKSELTNEVYSFYYNTGEGGHLISRVNADLTCEIVYQGDCLPLSADPKHAIEDWRVYLKYDKFCAHMGGKQLIWTDGLNPIGMIDVEASIASDSFTSDFFAYQNCREGCEYLQLCVPEPCGAPVGEFLPLEEGEEGLTNKMVDAGFQFRFRHVYYDQRASEWSDISTLYFQNTKDGCAAFDDVPRCMKFRLPIGNPMVERIEFAFRKDNSTQWFLYESIDKYEPYTSEDQKWFEREMKDLPFFSNEDCSFDYVFCNDKECSPIDPNQTSRTFNPIPREAQGLLRIKDSLAFYNYKKGNCPLLEDETKKFEISIDETTECSPEMVTVQFNVLIHSFNEHVNVPIFKLGADPNERVYFGGAQYNGPASPSDAMLQYFPEEVNNFIAYVEGTNYWTKLSQWTKRPFSEGGGYIQLVDDGGPVKNAGVANGAALWIRAARNNRRIFFQKGVITVPKGTRGFIRLAAHTATNGRLNNQIGSTQVVGTVTSIPAYQVAPRPGGVGDNAGIDISSIITWGKKELYFDTCDGSTIIEETLVVADHDVMAEGSAYATSAVSGYVRDLNARPLEGLEVWFDGTLKGITDHNGYYHLDMRYEMPEGHYVLDIRGELSAAGSFQTLKTENVIMVYKTNVIKDIEIDHADYQKNYFEDVSIIVTDCDANPLTTPVRVAMSGSKSEVTGNDGIAHFRIRNYNTRARTITAVVMDANNCYRLDCEDNCNGCMPITNPVTLDSSFEGVGYTNIVMETGMNTENADFFNRGLKLGGRYEWGMVVSGNCGKASAVYPITIMDGSTPSEDSFMNIIKAQQKNRISFNTFSYNSNSLLLPEWADCLHIVRTKNQNPFELQWIVDKEERLPGNKVRLTIQSLMDYNAEFNYKTNTNYQYVEGDRVEFITGSDGNILTTAVYGLLNYQILYPFVEVIDPNVELPADFFNQIIIENDGNLPDDLVGAKIELQRPKDCDEENKPFFTVLTLPLMPTSGGVTLVNDTGEFSTFDTYFITRFIGSNNQIFEHKNPSDFWGDELEGISDIGKVHFKNKYENEKRWGRNISLNNFGQFNRFGDVEKTLNAPGHGDITSMGIYDGKIVLAIGEHDNAVFQVSDDFARVGADGIVRVAPPDAIISDAETKLQGKFGCKYPHIGSVLYGDGYALWADVSKGAYVKHDFGTATDIAQDKMNSYFNRKWNYMEAQNNITDDEVNMFRFITGFNHHTKEAMLTMKRLNGAGTMNEKSEMIAESETVCIDPVSEEFLTWAGFTPEGYSNIDVYNGTGCAFIAFRGGAAYIHPVISNVFNRFFGVATDRVVTISVNAEPDIIKRFVGLEVQSRTMWFVSKVLVDNPSFESEIPPIRFKQQEDKWVASFLCDKNGRGGLYASDIVGVKPRGYYALITFVKDNTDQLKYNTTNDLKRIAADELDMIIVKYFYSSQSGFRENV